MALGTRASPIVFLDTQVFVQQNFQFSTGLLAALREQVRRQRLQCVTTDLTLEEVGSRLHSAVDHAEGAFRRFQSQARALRNSRAPHIVRLFKSFNRRRILRELLQQLEAYLAAIHPIVLQVDSVPPSVIFGRYFKGDVPFHRPTKKSEFPDAFVLEALRQYSKKAECPIVVVTGDRDWHDPAKPDDPAFNHTERLESVLETALENTPLLAAARQALEGAHASISTSVAEQFKGLSFMIGDRDAAVVGVKDIEVNITKGYIADATDENVVFSIDLWLSFAAEIDYSQRRSGMLPGSQEALRRPRFGTGEEPTSIWGSESFNISGSLSWTGTKPESAKLVDTIITDTRDIVVFAEDYYSS